MPSVPLSVYGKDGEIDMFEVDFRARDYLFLMKDKNGAKRFVQELKKCFTKVGRQCKVNPKK